ncbi:MAG: response regulator [Planctomycetota bacterium]|nr:response regulator [Planctomycetota bacterium]MCX8040581.1 response regulator [Planctomycetota bacterium]MDW8373053.1 response regulator [Planctomycetota bacterium]
MPKTVLVVDDSAMMRKIVIKNLKDCGFDVQIVEAGDGKEGLEKFSAGGIDLVLTDWNMPNMDGVTMVREIRKLDPEKKIPIIMITTEGSADKVKEAVLAGASNYLAKPFTPDRFKEKLGKFLA